MYKKTIDDLITNNKINDRISEIQKIISSQNNDDIYFFKNFCLNNENLFLIFDLLLCYSLIEKEEKIEFYEKIIHNAIEEKIFLKINNFNNKEIEELINIFIDFYFNYLLIIKKFKKIEFNLIFIFDFLSNLYKFNELIIHNKKVYILETWNFFNSINLNEHYNINLYYIYTKKLLILIDVFDYIFRDINSNKEEKEFNLIEKFYNNISKKLDNDVIFLIVKTLHNFSNTYIELNKKDAEKLIYFNFWLSYFLIKTNNYKNKYLFFFLISNINYINHYKNYDYESLKFAINVELNEFNKNEENKEDYLKNIKYIKKMFSHKENILNLFN